MLVFKLEVRQSSTGIPEVCLAIWLSDACRGPDRLLGQSPTLRNASVSEELARDVYPHTHLQPCLQIFVQAAHVSQTVGTEPQHSRGLNGDGDLTRMKGDLEAELHNMPCYHFVQEGFGSPPTAMYAQLTCGRISAASPPEPAPGLAPRSPTPPQRGSRRGRSPPPTQRTPELVQPDAREDVGCGSPQKLQNPCKGRTCLPTLCNINKAGHVI